MFNLKNNKKGVALFQGAVGLAVIVVAVLFAVQYFSAGQQVQATVIGGTTVPITSSTDNVVLKASAFDLAGDTAGGTQVAITTFCEDVDTGLVINSQEATLTSGLNTIANYGKGKNVNCVASNTTYLGVKQLIKLDKDLVPIKLDTYRICDSQDMSIEVRDNNFVVLKRDANNFSNSQRFTLDIQNNRTNSNCVYPFSMLMVDYDDSINNNISTFNLGGNPSLQRSSKLEKPTSISLIPNPYFFKALENIADQSWIIRAEGPGTINGKDAKGRDLSDLLIGEADVLTLLGGSIETDSVGCGTPTGTTDDNDFTFDMKEAIWQLTKNGKTLYFGIENDLDTPTLLGKARYTGNLQTCSTQG